MGRAGLNLGQVRLQGLLIQGDSSVWAHGWVAPPDSTLTPITGSSALEGLFI